MKERLDKIGQSAIGHQERLRGGVSMARRSGGPSNGLKKGDEELDGPVLGTLPAGRGTNPLSRGLEARSYGQVCSP